MTPTDSPETPRARNRYRLVVATGLVALACGLGVWAASGGRRPDDSGSPSPTPTDPSGDPGSIGPPWFADVTAGSGLDFTHRNGEEAGHFTILETLGGGVALLDYDGDGRLDLFLTGGGEFGGPDRKEIKGHQCKLYRNLGNWKFEDVTAQTGLAAVAWWYNHGTAVADYDRDGWPDLAVTGYGRVALFRNELDAAGGRRFTDVTEKVGLKDTSWASSAGWADIDGDGFPELYVCHYVDWSFANDPVCTSLVAGKPRDVCGPQKFKPLIHSLFKNEAGEAFRDVASEKNFKAAGSGLGVVLVDVNDDRRPDIYVANDAANNFLFFNRGGGRLEENGLLAGVAVNDTGKFDGSMGTDAGDYDGSGRPSLWVTNFQGELHALYKNYGRERFQHHSRASGLGTIGMHFVGFGTGFIDADHDGWEDLVVANGHVVYHPILDSTHRQLPIFLRNVDYQGRRFYRDLGATAGPYFRAPTVGRGLAIGDLDNDGWPDLAISHTNTPVVLLRNVVRERAPAKWIGLRLTGREKRDVVGSTVEVETDTRTLTKFIKGGGSYLSANDPRLLFGLGTAGVVKRVTVKWAWGEIQTWGELETGAYWELREGESKANRLPAVP